MQKHRDIKLLTTETNKKELFSIRAKLSYNNFFSEKSLFIDMKKTQIITNKSVYLGLSILKISEIVMYEF